MLPTNDLSRNRLMHHSLMCRVRKPEKLSKCGMAFNYCCNNVALMFAVIALRMAMMTTMMKHNLESICRHDRTPHTFLWLLCPFVGIASGLKARLLERLAGWLTGWMDSHCSHRDVLMLFLHFTE